MGSVNVNRNVSDAFYRYKMPRLMAKVEGKGNGIKTVLVNMAEVAKAIGRPATYPTKFFGCELGAQTQFDFKHDRFIVNGAHDAGKLQDLLDGFIRKYVLCPECDNPETELMISTKKGTIHQGCKACGYYGSLESNHKLNAYILKNPPNLNPAAQGSSLTEGKRNRRSKKGTENGEGGRSSSPEENNSELIVEAPEKLAEDKEDDNWAVDVSEEAVRARMQDLTDGAKGLTIDEDTDKTEKERMDIFYNKVQKARDSGSILAKELVAEAERLEVKSKATLVLAELLFDDKIHLQLKKHRVLFLRFCHEDQKAQRYLIGGIEQVIGLHKSILLPKVSAILKLFYDADILEESVLLDWASKISKKYVSKELSQEIHNYASQFITWLKEAEEEEESADESDDELEIEYNDRVHSNTLKAQPAISVAKTTVAVEDNEDDVDIDAI
ncbi:eukaryotic translation initiation factor 5 [Daktulosphaira vitifoliae]|uniref:eukaryotic translation initiation factor 5 n=1 Tax=Daktulosphaira vitifoliae TaxID=58002 RepID=UPI0021A9C84F|nr:eukaryotic translation initiation factor 5 [Daktulosphaira vitifoliae]XP_050521082.1 eukaryotic translation initiation factor 5 [Daktulosphaira vitifoliae]XP_050521083.1 eukaryotic translation initiation factor 5 [Daktulosphaira vitifoliae]XP_050521085.1 eukaryotic translation initiation factor 5 [Daktulosphaira vitifoliae]